MSEWLARARQHHLREENPAPEGRAKIAKMAKMPFEAPAKVHFGNFGNFGATSSISLEEIRGRFDWIALRLREEHGMPPALAHERALEVLGSELRNDPRLVPVQQDPRSCLICSGPTSSSRVLAAILSPHADQHLWLHLEPCHAEFFQQQVTKVAILLADAGLSER